VRFILALVVGRAWAEETAQQYTTVSLPELTLITLRHLTRVPHLAAIIRIYADQL